MTRALVRLSKGTLSLLRETRGSIALKFALIVPGIVTLGAGAIDLHAVHASRDRLQSIADAGALAGAPSLGLAADGVTAKARAESFVRGAISEWRDAPTWNGVYEVVDQQQNQRALRVSLRANRPSFFANMLPPGGWDFSAAATATSMSMAPLCVLVTSPSDPKTLNVKDRGRLSAPACMVHSNKHIAVEGGSISAAIVQASGRATGVISPTPGSGAAVIHDPFADVPLSDQHGCGRTPKIDVKTGVYRLAPGVHCQDLIFAGDAQLILEPGDHWFVHSKLEMKEQSRLIGVDVALLFNKDAKFDFKDNATVNLDGRKSGTYAGMVLLATRQNKHDFIIDSDHVESLLGVIYVPTARLIIEGKADVARESAWTVIVADRVELRGSPSVFVNADYDASDVPVPAGVGPRSGGSVLVE